MTELEKRCYILEEENMIYKEDLKNLRTMLEKLVCENCEMKAELKILRNESLNYKCFNKDGEEAVEELLEILKKDDKLTIVKRKNGNYYRIFNKFGGNIFVIENYNCGRAQKGLLTTPEPRKIMSSDKSKFDKYTKDWEYYGKTKERKQYDFRNKPISEIINLLNKFI
tara:strand:- start:584 stop:1087 length:504 start_codon:yes stop_codon:yes gene_type:complete